MSIKKRRMRRRSDVGLLITPMIDMFTVILIFLVVSYSPEASRIQKSAEIELPRSQATLSKLPQLQVEVSDQYVIINGEKIVNQGDQMWTLVQERLDRFRDSNPERSGLIISDQKTAYKWIDRTVAHMSASGISQVYFLTQED